LIAKKADFLNPMITSGLDSVGLRCPDHPETLKLLSMIDGGIAAPSANKFGKTSPTLSSHVETEFNHQIAVIEGGPCQIGIESTVLGIEKNENTFIAKIYRPGFYTPSKIKEILLKHHMEIQIQYHQSPVAPGQLEHHYMPKIPLIIVPEHFNWEKSEEKNKFFKPALWYQPKEALIASRELYAKMREFDSQGFDVIICFENDKINTDEWLGIWNRLNKAKSYRVSSI
jgi:L-threonylcarbamoyladenylate synthase